MSGAGRYAELAAAVRSFKAELIQPNQIERLIEAGSLSETISVLTEGKVTAGEGTDLAAAESYLIQRTIDLTHRLVSYAPSDSRGLIKLFSVGFELACVKEILRSIAELVEPEDALRHIVPAGKFTADRCKELIEARNPSRVIDAIEDETLRRFMASKVAGERSRTAAVAAIDQYYYSRLWAASSLPDPLDTQSARSILGQLIDHLNILLALRARLVGLDARSTSELFIPVNYALGHALTELAESTNIPNLMRVLEKTPYAGALQNLAGLETNSVAVERALNRSHATTCVNAFAGSPFNVGLALAFLFLKNYELRDLFAVINGKANNVPADRVIESLILRRS
jgi:vacuolar-type H+-ATPase subunit C/Vma6